MDVEKASVREPVYLRSLEMEDLARIHRWHNDAELYDSLVPPHRFVSATAVEQWLRQRIAYSTKEVALAICVSANSEHIGNIYLRNIDWVARHAILGIFIGDRAHQSKGYGPTAIRLVMRHAFENLGLLRLSLRVIADNERAVKAYEKCGFQVEGRLRRHAYKDGQFKDVLYMGVCAGDIGGYTPAP